MHPIKQKLKIITSNLKEDNIQNLVIRNHLKEYLQDVFLHAIYNHSRLKELIFYGGSCLRKVYGLNRLSEDLDFETRKKLDLNIVKKILVDYFKRREFDDLTFHIQTSENIKRITARFPILYDLDLSPHLNEKLHVKIEIAKTDGKYPTELTPYTKDRYSILLKHYSLPVLMAGKIAACLTRIFEKGDTGIEIKGRDFYDLVWYMQKKVEPNMKLLRDLNIADNRKQAFDKIDNKVKQIKSKDLFVDLEPLFRDRAFIKDWCQDFHKIYDSVRKYYDD